jgi:S1-C subfamily serine protease
MRLDDLVDGMCARKAGLRKGDVLVTMDGRLIINDFNSLPNAIAGKKGGDIVDVVFYRGLKRKR